MKIKGLSKIIVSLVCMQDDVNDMIDEIDTEDSKYEERDNYYNDVWNQLEAAIIALRDIPDIKLSGYL